MARAPSRSLSLTAFSAFSMSLAASLVAGLGSFSSAREQGPGGHEDHDRGGDDLLVHVSDLLDIGRSGVRINSGILYHKEPADASRDGRRGRPRSRADDLPVDADDRLADLDGDARGFDGPPDQAEEAGTAGNGHDGHGQGPEAVPPDDLGQLLDVALAIVELGAGDDELLAPSEAPRGSRPGRTPCNRRRRAGRPPGNTGPGARRGGAGWATG